MKTGNLDSAIPAKGLVIWLTGLSGAGKTTLARALRKELLQTGQAVEVLDGDEVRENLSHGLGFSKEDRDRNVSRIGFVARLLARNGIAVLVSAISPYRQSRDDARHLIESDDVRFIEVFVRCPLEVLITRDVKGLYKKALAGEILSFTGVSDPYEAPLAPDCIVDSSTESIAESLSEILSRVGATASSAKASSAKASSAKAPHASVIALEQTEAIL